MLGTRDDKGETRDGVKEGVGETERYVQEGCVRVSRQRYLEREKDNQKHRTQSQEAVKFTALCMFHIQVSFRQTIQLENPWSFAEGLADLPNASGNL